MHVSGPDVGMTLQVVIIGFAVWLSRNLPKVWRLEKRIHGIAATVAAITQDDVAASATPVAQVSGDILSIKSQLAVMEYQIARIIAETGTTVSAPQNTQRT